MIYYKITVPDRNDAVMRVNLDGNFYNLRTTWNEFAGFWMLSVYDASMNLLIGMERLSPGAVWNFFYSGVVGPPGLLGVVTESDTVGRSDFVTGKAALVYVPAAEMGV